MEAAILIAAIVIGISLIWAATVISTPLYRIYSEFQDFNTRLNNLNVNTKGDYNVTFGNGEKIKIKL